MTQVRGDFSQSMAVGLRKIYTDADDLEQKAEEWPFLFKETKTDSQYEQDLEMAGVGPLQEKPENSATAYNDMIQGGSKRVIPLTYSLGIRSSKELMDDAKYGIIKQGPKYLARSGRFTRETIAWAVFNQGFSSTFTSFDGNPLFYNQHALLGGPAATNLGPGLANVISSPGTYPNRPATDIDLSVAGIQLAINQSSRMVDNQGFPIAIKFKYILIPPELRFITREILGSAGQPYTSDNTINSLLAEDLKFIEGSYLQSSSAWFMLAAKEHTALEVIMRESMKTSFDSEFDTDAVKQKVRMRMAVWCPRWQGIWGSNGP
jgi:hypothetical protein